MKNVFAALPVAAVLALVFAAPVPAETPAAPAALAPAPTLDMVRAGFEKTPVVRCAFRNERRVKGLARPLVSRGEVLVARGAGLRWHQTRPFKMTLLAQPHRLVQTVDDQPPQVVTAASNPQIFRFGHLLADIFNANIAALEKNFTVRFTGTAGGGWTLALTPRGAPLDKVFRQITLDGASPGQLDGVVIEDAQGDTSRLRFTDHKTAPATLTDAERALFAK